MGKIFYGSSQHSANTECCNSQCATKTPSMDFQYHRIKIHPSLRRHPHHQLQPRVPHWNHAKEYVPTNRNKALPNVQKPKHLICLMSHVLLYIDFKHFNAIGGTATSLHMNTSMLSFGSHRFETPCVPHCTAKKTKRKKNIKPPNHSKTCMSSYPWQWTIQWRNPSFFGNDVSLKEGFPRHFKCTATQTKGRPSFVVPTTTVQTHVDWHLIAFCFFFRFCLVRRTLFEPTKIGLTFKSKSQQTMRAKMSRVKAQSSLSVPIYDRSPIGEVQDIVLWYLEATKVDL